MSRPDWGALQQEYIAEYTRSGISPVAWCEATRKKNSPAAVIAKASAEAIS